METLIFLFASIISLYFGRYLLMRGIKAIKNREPNIGPLDHKHGIVSGPLCIFAGILIFIKLVIIPVFFE